MLKAIGDFYPNELEVVAINDLTDTATNAHLFKYDTNYGIFDGTVEAQEKAIVVNGKEIAVLAERDPAKLPWGDLGVRSVVESTGFFTDAAKAGAHLQGGAKKVIISAPAKGEDITIVLGVNEDKYDPAKHTHHLQRLLHDQLPGAGGQGRQRHLRHRQGPDDDRPLLHQRPAHPRPGPQGPAPGPRRGGQHHPDHDRRRQGVGLVIPELKGKFHGISLRVPTPTVSIVDFVADVSRDTTVEEVNAAFKTAAEGPMKGILPTPKSRWSPSTSRATAHSSIVDALTTMVIGGNMVKVLAWYDNEWGYSCRVADLCQFMVKKGIR